MLVLALAVTGQLEWGRDPVCSERTKPGMYFSTCKRSSPRDLFLFLVSLSLMCEVLGMRRGMYIMT